ncbi:MAG: bifunctional diaminohydroxyphosphoribosylaminopyrimidine deaminase/5-amino-6-(5-phosphoribosylamino)uracil reductase RibD [Bacteroidota bacterium]|nr:bifunctional diaminohydroxyphosphoribosylaminopyrimidine deaminase/5-amino-6-(5-phosphoribosylamino)uracil reductase RibD [Bacteroidota bacterium]
MHRCLQLAALGEGSVAPNPMVGAVLVFEDRIIGEGYHQKFGEAHAEVNCISSVRPEDRHLIEKSALYVSLEPCSHYGKTPPCTNLILANRIKKVFIGSLDPFPAVSGKGVEILTQAGVEVTNGLLESECLHLNRRFITFHTRSRPYLILKWAQSLNGKIGSRQQRIKISHPVTDRIVHRWRAQEASILVGTRTAEIDDPLLTVRLWPGKNPLRVVIDNTLSVSPQSRVLNEEAETVIFNQIKEGRQGHLQYKKYEKGEELLSALLSTLYHMQVQSVLVEGGAHTLQQFIDRGLWDEARVITNESLTIEDGVPAPELNDFIWDRSERYQTDLITWFTHRESTTLQE